MEGSAGAAAVMKPCSRNSAAVMGAQSVSPAQLPPEPGEDGDFSAASRAAGADRTMEKATAKLKSFFFILFSFLKQEQIINNEMNFRAAGRERQ